MLSSTRCRLSSIAARIAHPSLRPLSTSTRFLRQGPGAGENFAQANDPTPRTETPNVSKTNELAVDALGAQDAPLQEMEHDAERQRQLQAPNRATVWSRSQMPRELAMSGPRFEQTIMEFQPQPYAAIELIHKQPVRWVHSRSVACDGGGGPLGHPRIFINTDKPQICFCTYCGLPYANEHHRKLLESLPSTSYPLEPTEDAAQVPLPGAPHQPGEVQGKHPHLMGEIQAQGSDQQGFSQR